MSCAGVASAALTLTVLLLHNVRATLPTCDLDTYDYESRPSCKLLADRYNDSLWIKDLQCLSVRGRLASVELYWGSPPSHAASALLLATLRHVLQFRRINLKQGPHEAGTLIHSFQDVSFNNPRTSYAIALSTAWGSDLSKLRVYMDQQASTLSEFGHSSVPANRRLHASLSAGARQLPDCQQYSSWTFYTNTTALAICGFVDDEVKSNATLAVVLYEVYDTGDTLRRLVARANHTGVSLRVVRVDFPELMKLLRNASNSFLYLDYDIWMGEQNVSIIDPPPCYYNFGCQEELDSSTAIRLADVQIFRRYAPQLFSFVSQFYPILKDIRTVLERVRPGVDIEEAACDVILKNNDLHSRRPEHLYEYTRRKYIVAVLYCFDDPLRPGFGYLINKLRDILHWFKSTQYDILLKSYKFDCADTFNTIRLRIENRILIRFKKIYMLLGIVLLGMEDMETGAALASSYNVPLMLADIATDASADASTTWRVAGSPRHLMRALHHFVLESGWTRLAVLSEPTTLAEANYAALEEEAHIALHDYNIPLHITKLEAIETIRELQAANARIVYINTDSKAAAVILSAAQDFQMGYADGFVWITREWQPSNLTSNTTHFSISLWSRSIEDIPQNIGQSKLRMEINQIIYPDRAWPPRISSFVDAVLTLVLGIQDVFRRYPDTQGDIHTEYMIRSLNESLKTPVMGINRMLQYKNRTIEEVSVFMTQWRGDVFEQIATWRVNATARSNTVRGNYTPPADLPRDDGASHCIARFGDSFEPDCYDTLLACMPLLLALLAVAVLLGLRILRRRIDLLLKERELEVKAQRQHVATALAAYLVKRDSLELREELGVGRFGCVRMALFKTSDRVSRYVAAKALRDNAAAAEESEFLREACTIASLNHKHIVRLVGVCIAEGPPLVLMEMAFFGDLLKYLRARRHLAEGVSLEPGEACEEAEHISTEALTRLASEAAAALAYLEKQGVVHCDVRAANCLVDARRSLKLADFGMARQTLEGKDGAPEYACRRRGLFPVLWMAPESLAHGVFSPASDVWAFGVLVLEMVTLGGRPYGAMSPLRVLEYVTAGGRPPLPLDATPHTRGLMRLCWQQEAGQRPSAAEVQDYLQTHPRTLHPALLNDAPLDPLG